MQLPTLVPVLFGTTTSLNNFLIVFFFTLVHWANTSDRKHVSMHTRSNFELVVLTLLQKNTPEIHN